MRWVTIAKKSGLEVFREPMSLFFMLLFPMIFIFIFGAAFGSFTGGNTTYKLGLINLDEGLELNDTVINHGENLLEILENIKYQDSEGRNTSVHVFEVRLDLTEKKAQELVEDQEITAYIVIPRNFTEGVIAESMRYVKSAISSSIQDQFESGLGETNTTDPQAMENFMKQMISEITGGDEVLENIILDYDENTRATVEIQGDPGGASYYTVSSILESIFSAYIKESGLRTLEEAREILPFSINPDFQEPNVILENKAYEASDFSIFDYQVPGFFVFALLMGAMTVTIFMAREETRGTLSRLKITKMSSFDLLFGTCMIFMLIAVAQLFILLGAALLLNFHYHPDANIGLALLIAMIGALASVALGLIMAALAKNEEQAGSIAPAITVPLSFATGAFFEMPTVILTNNFMGTGKSFGIFDFLPWSHCTKGLSKVLIYGADFQEVSYDISLLTLLTIILFIISVILYHKRRLRSI